MCVCVCAAALVVVVAVSVPPLALACLVVSLYEVDECEIKVIKETFKDLCHLNGGSMRIDKETFLQYLPLPGLLGGESSFASSVPCPPLNYLARLLGCVFFFFVLCSSLFIDFRVRTRPVQPASS